MFPHHQEKDSRPQGVRSPVLIRKPAGIVFVWDLLLQVTENPLSLAEHKEAVVCIGSKSDTWAQLGAFHFLHGTWFLATLSVASYQLQIWQKELFFFRSGAEGPGWKATDLIGDRCLS